MLILKTFVEKTTRKKECSKRVPEMTELSHNCFVENNVLWKRINRHNGQQTVVAKIKALTEQLLSEIHGNVLFSHEGQYKIKERLIQSHWWQGMDANIIKHLKKCDKFQKTSKDKRPTTKFSCSIKESTWICFDHSKLSEVARSTCYSSLPVIQEYGD